MLNFPGDLDSRGFLARHWQKDALLMPGALKQARPSVSRNDLAWLATQEDVESRLVFVDYQKDKTRYRVESGPFDGETLSRLPQRNWTLLVQDVEKHLPTLRRWFDYVPFIPDWRIDDLMISFAAPGGGVGPHQDNYDVFLCQGAGVRRWRYSADPIAEDPKASDSLRLVQEFSGATSNDCRAGDVLYLPPGVAHWGVAKRACITYSIGMRAPELTAIAAALGQSAPADKLYIDPDLSVDEASPGFISRKTISRVAAQLGVEESTSLRQALGKTVSECKPWLKPDLPTGETVDAAIAAGHLLRVHGMARIAYDDDNCYVNGRCLPLEIRSGRILDELCRKRRWTARTVARLAANPGTRDLLRQLLQSAAFDLD